MVLPIANLLREEPPVFHSGNQLKEFRHQHARVDYALAKKFPTPLRDADIDAN